MASNFKQTVDGLEGNSPSSSRGDPGDTSNLDGMNLFDLVSYLNCLGVNAKISATETSITLTIEGKKVRFTGGEAAADAAYQYVRAHIAELEKRLSNQPETAQLS